MVDQIILSRSANKAISELMDKHHESVCSIEDTNVRETIAVYIGNITYLVNVSGDRMKVS